VVSWRFDAPANEQSVAILIPEGTPDHIRITAYNLDQQPVTAHMTGWEIDPGQWEITQGGSKRTEDFERSRDLTFTFAPGTTTDLELKLLKPGVPYWSRPDLGIDRDDVKVSGSRMTVTVQSCGSRRRGKGSRVRAHPHLESASRSLPQNRHRRDYFTGGRELEGGNGQHRAWRQPA
jgi:hypothetical protein